MTTDLKNFHEKGDQILDLMNTLYFEKSVPVQTSDQDKRRTGTNVGQYKRRTSTNVRPVQTSDYRKKVSFILKCYFLLSTGLIKIYPKELSSCHRLKYSHPYLYNLVLTFNTFKLKRYDLIDFIG